MSLIIDIKVVPSSGKFEWTIDKTGTLKCYLKSKPERDKANQELLRSLSKYLKTDKVQILLGRTSRKKKIKIDLNITFEELLKILGIERQLSI
jgi:uncharacterized protein (TIGR00251 family)